MYLFLLTTTLKSMIEYVDMKILVSMITLLIRIT